MAFEVSQGLAAGVSAGVSRERRAPARYVAARRARVVTALTVLVDLVAVCMAYVLSRAAVQHALPGFNLLSDLNIRVLLTVPIWPVVFYGFGLYGRRQILEPAARITVVLSAITVSIFLFVLATYANGLEPARARTAVLWIIAAVLIVGGRLIILGVIHQLNEVRWLGLRTLIVGVNGEGRTLARVLSKKRHLGYEVIGFIGSEVGPPVEGIPIVGTVQTLRESAIDGDVAAVFIAGSSGGPETLVEADKALLGLSVRVRTTLGLPYLSASRVVVGAVDGMAMLSLERARPSELALHVKRAMDILLSGMALLAGSPIFLAIAVAIRLSGDGPIFFSQTRVGAGGEFFTMYKFRTMVNGAENLRPQLEDSNEADGVLFKMKRDPRITPIGRHLRRWGLDELPQLVNVLWGDMSLVGPRPALPAEMEHWTSELGARLRAKPGLTGLWQVSGRHELAFDDYVRYDLFYVENWSLGLDLQIIARTLPALIARTGAF